MDVDLDWIRSEFRRSLCALGAEGRKALAGLPDGCAKADELAEDYSHWLEVYMQHFSAEFSRVQRGALSRIDDLLSEMSGENNAELWTDEAVMTHARWRLVRSAALAAIQAIGIDCSANTPMQTDDAARRR